MTDYSKGGKVIDPPYVGGYTLVAVCISSSLYGKIGDMGRLGETRVHDKSWAHISDLVRSGSWRIANEIESVAYKTGFKNMEDAVTYVDSGTYRMAGIWKQIHKGSLL